MRSACPFVSLCLSAVLFAAVGGGTALAKGNRIAEGRYHLKKANALAGQNECEAAVREYTAAYEKLHDPVVFFNRAECYRRMGENAKAAADYRAFLKGFPAAHNRAEIEGRIAALERPSSSARAEPEAAPPVVATPPPPRPPPPAAKPPPPPAAKPPPPPKPAETAERERPQPKLEPWTPPLAAEPEAAPVAPRETQPEAPLVRVPQTAAAKADQEEKPGRARWWVWATVAGLLVAGGAAGYLLLRPHGQSVPPTDLGSYRF
jgi:tetratricopeptide (TPR) repeat protein